MNEKMIEYWNDRVGRGDIVYHLGDFGFGKEEETKKIRFRLKGKIHLILGNHDYKNRIVCSKISKN
jgi:calcineurin-like phosphoesterase family protein